MIWSPIQGSDLKFAVNTNWDLFETPSKTLYLRNNDIWLTASDLKGPWSTAGTLPPSFAKLPANDDWTDVKANIPGRPPTAGAVPMVYVSTSPAEMLLLRGAPVYQPVPGTSLLWVSNTDSDVFRLGKAGNRDRAGRRSRGPRRGAPHRTSECEGAEGSGRQLRGWSAAVSTCARDDARSRRQHGQGHREGRRPSPLRVPKLYNLRMDPFERADITSSTYWDWFAYRAT